jgi:DNA-directed RNA polymerase alpha subunit
MHSPSSLLDLRAVMAREEDRLTMSVWTKVHIAQYQIVRMLSNHGMIVVGILPLLHQI